jgi:transcriptional regulator with XRE-family HTH domain
MINKTPQNLQKAQEDLGERVRQLRIRSGLTQAELAAQANTGLRAIRNLETGSGTTVETLIRALLAMGRESDLQTLAPMPSVSPMAQLRQSRHPRRAGTTRRPKDEP